VEEIFGAPNAQELFDEYSAECSVPMVGKINLKRQMYDLFEESGMLDVFGVYDGEELIGFGSVLFSELPHYSLHVANVESLFIASAHRAGGTGRALMLAMEDRSAARGCKTILYNARVDSQFEKMLATSHDYVLTNYVYCRRID
jgi:GNAT superfamily N-acetyltransferase